MKRKIQSLLALVLASMLWFTLFACTNDEEPQEEISISLNYTTASLIIGESLQLVASSNSNKPIDWTTSNFYVASVINGKITAKNSGTANITATQGNSQIVCVVTVHKPTLSVNFSVATLKVGESMPLIVTTNSPLQAKWKYYGTSINISLNGIITALHPGTANIEVEVAGAKAYCSVIVKK